MPASDATTDLTAIIAANIRAARRSAGLTQHALAVAIGRGDAMTVSRWERAEHRPSDESLVALAEALQRPIAWFYVDHAGTA
jgi:transcriptional regulator with XRE-family HTH domain